MKYNTLNKTELKITGIKLNNTNLHDVAACVARVCGLDRDKVLVIDVRDEVVALDVLQHDLDPRTYAGKEKQLLQKLAELPGVTLQPKARVTSDGMLGWIAFDASEEQLSKSIDMAEEMARSAMETISNRVLVYPSGTELIRNEIEDTNTPMLLQGLTAAGYQPEAGTILEDDEDKIVLMLRRGIDKGFGVIITTGGVGAEDKDHSVESVLRLDPQAATPYIAKFQKGHGRHVKEGIRIAVGQIEHVRLITLPGPNDEVAACIPVLIDGLQRNLSKEVLANALADVLRNRLQKKCGHKHAL